MPPSGGARKGAGRPKGGGKYKEPTKAVRLPISMIGSLEKGLLQTFPLYLSKVSAGFPSPADDELAEKLDLNQYLIRNPAATFLVRANGNSMVNAGINDNDILIVDRSITPTSGKIVIVAIDGLLTVKRLKKDKNGQLILLAENPDYPPIHVQEGNEVYIWGVVTQVIHGV